ncbi:MAG: hypothetical protein AVDCRST_MAG06-2603 [uncultured Nocardioides sp.]|uniref:Uncharacterized protein n=1 Tax=uncultured Nocardioides sp. TaxID=198441 RepID=A0A6J4P698_9ACTN|nr:MAG: hypothetical protein AVDCRST_MAG06-2603 [uncultured Nocardioides sp.]
MPPQVPCVAAAKATVPAPAGTSTVGETQDAGSYNGVVSIYGGARSWFGASHQGRRRKREPGGSPGLPRSGEWERPVSSALSHGPRPRLGKRHPVGTSSMPTSPKTCQRTAPPTGAVVRGLVGGPEDSARR